jgi:hypothetical protein
MEIGSPDPNFSVFISLLKSIFLALLLLLYVVSKSFYSFLAVLAAATLSKWWSFTCNPVRARAPCDCSAIVLESTTTFHAFLWIRNNLIPTHSWSNLVVPSLPHLLRKPCFLRVTPQIQRKNLYRLCEHTLVQITIYLMLMVLFPQKKVSILLGSAAHQDSSITHPMAYALTQRLSLVEKTLLPSFLLAASG